MHNQRGKAWLITGGTALFLLALFWSVDQVVIYFCLTLATFSFFQYFLSGGAVLFKPSFESPHKPQTPKIEKTIDFVLKDLKSGLRNTSFSTAALGCVRAGVGFFTLFIVLAVIALIFFDEETGFASYYFKANEFYTNGQYDSAAYYYRLAAQEDPEFPAVYFDWGNTLVGLNRYDTAIYVYDRALAIFPEYTEAHYGKAFALYQSGRYREAIGETRMTLNYEPDHLNAMLLTGDCFYTQQQLDSALYYYTGAYSTGYRNAVLCHLMAYIYDTRGQTNLAIKHYKEAVELDGSLAEVFARLGELVPGEEGNRYRNRAAELNP